MVFFFFLYYIIFFQKCALLFHKFTIVLLRNIDFGQFYNYNVILQYFTEFQNLYGYWVARQFADTSICQHIVIFKFKLTIYL